MQYIFVTKIDWGFFTPREIPDPYVSKPDDWVEEEYIIDPDDKKPAGWDDIPVEIPDPKAVEPGILHFCGLFMNTRPYFIIDDHHRKFLSYIMIRF